MAIPILAINDNVVVRQVAKNSAQYGVNVLNYTVNGVVGAPTTVGDVATYFDGVASAFFLNLISSAASYWGYGARVISAVSTPEYYDNALRGVGHGGVSLLPTQSAPLVSWRTPIGNRKGRGRTYLSFAASDALNNDASITAAYRAAMVLWSDFVSGTITVPNITLTGSVNLGLVVTDALFGTNYPVVRYLIRTYLATQRRREENNRADNDPFSGSVHV